MPTRAPKMVTCVGVSRSAAAQAGDDEPERAKEVNVDQLLDFVGFESKTLRKNRLAVSRRHKAVASTQILRGCKSRSGGLQPPFAQARPLQTAAP